MERGLRWLAALLALGSLRGVADEPPRDATSFQTGEGWEPALDVGADVALVYGARPDLAQRLAS